MPELVRSAVAIISSPTHYVLEDRPDLPGRICNPGEVSLLGGHEDYPNEPLMDIICRELLEELEFKGVLPEPSFLRSERRPGVNPKGQPIMREIGLFSLLLMSADDVSPLPPTQLFVIEKELRAVSETTNLTIFTREVLTSDLIVSSRSIAV